MRTSYEDFVLVSGRFRAWNEGHATVFRPCDSWIVTVAVTRVRGISGDRAGKFPAIADLV
jgi:hypothetical protein